MPTLIIHLSGALQSWSVDEGLRHRTTGAAPSKSGVIGLIAAALGLSRDEAPGPLAGMRFGVRSDHPGKPLIDFHTAEDKSGTKKDKSGTKSLSWRGYLMDAAFTVGLESDDRDLLDRCSKALAHPYYIPFLGRKSCPPDEPLRGVIVDTTLEEALRLAPFDGKGTPMIEIEPKPEDPAGYPFVQTVRDQPVSYAMDSRDWRTRRVVTIQPTDNADARNKFEDDPFETIASSNNSMKD